MNAPAGWYPSPDHTQALRWWDGAQWTAQTQAYAPPTLASTPAEPVATQRSFAPVIGALSAAVLALGGFMPWVQVEVFGATVSRNGLDNGGDGWLTLVIGAGLLFLFIRLAMGSGARPAAVFALVIAAVALLVTVADYHDVQDRIDATDGIATMGVGLYAVIAGAVGSAIFALASIGSARSAEPLVPKVPGGQANMPDLSGW